MTDTPDLKTTAGKIADLNNRLAESRNPQGGATADDESPATGLSARERIDALVDAGSFVETDALARHNSTDFGREHDRPYTDGVVTGYATINGRKACVFSQDATIFDGTMGEAYGEKMVKLYDLALKTGVPVIGIHESAGPRVQEGIATLALYARVLARITEASGLIPQIAVVVGDNEGMAAFAPALADFLIFSRDGSLHELSPQLTGEAGAQECGGAQAQTRSGAAHLVADTDREALALARTTLRFLPVNNRAEAPRTQADISSGSIEDNVRDRDRELNELVPDAADDDYEIQSVITTVVDHDSFFELQADYAPNIVTGFAHIEGRAVGIVANQPQVQGGALDAAACEKAARFIRTCDAFNTPIIEFVDSPGFDSSVEAEESGLLRRASKLAFAYAEASVGKISVITRKAYGPAYVFMGSKDLGADLVYAWPTAEMAIAPAELSAQAIYGADATDKQVAEIAEKFIGPYAAAERSLADAVIEPATTRGYLVEGLRVLERKIIRPAPKKLSNIPL